MSGLSGRRIKDTSVRIREMFLRTGKGVLFGREEQPRVIWFGVGRGCRFLINPANKSQRILGLEECEIGHHFKRCVAWAGTFIDVGASDGYYAIIASKLNPSIESIGCDPKADMECRAWQNYRLNFPAGTPRMEWRIQAVGAEEGKIPLDDLAKGRQRPVFVKIDVDGFEIDVLRSGTGLLAEDRVAVLLEVHSPDLEARSIELMELHGLRCQVVRNAWWRLLVPERRPIELNRWVLAEKGLV